MQDNDSNLVTVLHFNDVYNIEERAEEPVGGAPRFLTAVKSFRNLSPLVLFSGDIFSPSMLSTYTKGAQMVPVLNEVGTHCAVYGNHDFDYGLEVLSDRVSETNFPWLMSNVIDNETGRPLGDGKITHLVHWGGRTIGLIGLVEQEWLDTLSMINPDEVTFIDFVEAGQKLSSQLKQEGCDCVIALTHMRMPNDVKLAEADTQIDLILGGHDHVYDVREINGKHVIKSGTDFRQFSRITLRFESAGQAPDVSVQRVDVTSQFVPDLGLQEQLDKYAGVMEGKLDEVLGEFAVELDGRFESIRRQETNLGNWVCDVVVAATGADLALLNSGTLRSDRIHPAGPFTLADLINVIPMQDPLVVLQVTGEQLHAALENSVSQYPKLEGRFPQVAGVSFAFEPEGPPGRRVPHELIRVGDEYLALDGLYSLATKAYLHSGCDGYTMLRNAKVLLGEEVAPELGMAIQNHFQAIKMRQGKTGRRGSKHRQSLVTLSRRHSLVKVLEGGEEGPPPLRRGVSIDVGGRGSVGPPQRGLQRRASLDELETETCLLAPRTQRRITPLSPRLTAELLATRHHALHDPTVIQEVDELDSPQPYPTL